MDAHYFLWTEGAGGRNQALTDFLVVTTTDREVLKSSAIIYWFDFFLAAVRTSTVITTTVTISSHIVWCPALMHIPIKYCFIFWKNGPFAVT